jgi:Ser-tRNA(Ala) deacylase AlaX
MCNSSSKIKTTRNINMRKIFWEIDGFAQVSCGGTHVKSTAEVGVITLKRMRPGKSVERIEIRLVDDSVSS